MGKRRAGKLIFACFYDLAVSESRPRPGKEKSWNKGANGLGFLLLFVWETEAWLPRHEKGGNGNITPQNMRIARTHWYPKEGKKKWSQKWWQMTLGLKFAFFFKKNISHENNFLKKEK